MAYLSLWTALHSSTQVQLFDETKVFPLLLLRHTFHSPPFFVFVAGSQTKSGDFTPSNKLYCYLLFQMMKHAWDSYRQYGWGHNELKPLAKKGHSTNIFGRPDKPLSPTAVCAHWQFSNTVVNHTWMHA